MQEAEVTLPGATSSVPTARRFVESLLMAWGRPEQAWSAAICVSELAGNCALHARTAFSVRVVLDEAGAVRLEISDGSVRAPAQRHYGPDATTGRGLQMVETCASSWGVDVTERGKTVWVVLEDPAGIDEPVRTDVGRPGTTEVAGRSSVDPSGSGPVALRLAA